MLSETNKVCRYVLCPFFVPRVQLDNLLLTPKSLAEVNSDTQEGILSAPCVHDDVVKFVSIIIISPFSYNLKNILIFKFGLHSTTIIQYVVFLFLKMFYICVLGYMYILKNVYGHYAIIAIHISTWFT